MSDDVQRHIEHAERLYSIGQIDGAIDMLRRVLSEDPDVADAHSWLALCLLRKRRLHAATVEAEIALSLAPESVLSRWVSAEIDVAKRDFASAERHVDSLLADSPQVPAFHLLKARCLTLTGRGRSRLPILQEALQHGPEEPETLAELVDYYAETGDLEQAHRLATDALRIAPENHSALVAMGTVLLLRGDVAGAREHAALALRADPSDPSALRLLTSIKTRSNPLLGLWWHYATWMERIGAARSVVVLLVAFVLYRLLVITATRADADGLAAGVQIAWLGLVVYSFVGPMLFRKALQRELATVDLRRF